MDQVDLIFNTAEGVLAVDRDQRIVLWNGGAEGLLGFKANEVLGRYCYEVLGGRNALGAFVCQESCRDLLQMRRQELVPTHDLLVRTKVGRDIWVNVSTIRIPSRRKDLCVLVHLFRDVSRQKEMERFVEQLLSNVAKLTLSQDGDPQREPPSPLPPAGLTGRQREVLRLLATGASTQTIAKKLFISPMTARNHIQHILTKLGVHSRLAAVALAVRSDLL